MTLSFLHTSFTPQRGLFVRGGGSHFGVPSPHSMTPGLSWLSDLAGRSREVIGYSRLRQPRCLLLLLCAQPTGRRPGAGPRVANDGCRTGPVRASEPQSRSTGLAAGTGGWGHPACSNASHFQVGMDTTLRPPSQPHCGGTLWGWTCC